MKVRHDEISSLPVELLYATLNRDSTEKKKGAPIPQGIHFLYFLPNDHTKNLNEEGHSDWTAPGGVFVNRMWGGASIEFFQQLHVGDKVFQQNKIIDVQRKHGTRSGDFVVVTEEITIYKHKPRALILREKRDIIYKSNAKLPVSKNEIIVEANKIISDVPTFSATLEPDEKMLFRFSALTFNSHRIHYDTPFTIQQGFTGLVVHGPLIAYSMLSLLEGFFVKAFRYRAIHPLTRPDSKFTVVAIKQEADYFQLCAYKHSNQQLIMRGEAWTQ